MVSPSKVTSSKIPMSVVENDFMCRLHSTSVRAREVASHYRIAVTSKVVVGLNGAKALGLESVHFVAAQVDKTTGVLKRTSAGAADRLSIFRTKIGETMRTTADCLAGVAKLCAPGHRAQKALGAKASNMKSQAGERASGLATSAVAMVPTPMKGRAAAALNFSQATSHTMKLKATEVRNDLGSKASELNTNALVVLAKPATKVTAASAAGAGAVGGAAGGAVGMTTGAGMGAAVGLVAAPFTLGLSIPACAMIGAGGGLCMGATLGGAAGVVGGGTVGYGAYSKRDEIRSAAVTAQKYADRATERYGASKASVAKTLRSSASSVTRRLRKDKA